MILLELFSQPVKWVWKGSNEEVTVSFKVGEVPYKLYANQVLRPDGGDKDWEVEFKIDDAFAFDKRIGRHALSGTGNASVVMATVVDILKNFIKEYDGEMDTLTFTALEESRKALYARMIKKLLPNWTVSSAYSKAGKSFTLVKPTIK